MDTLKKPLAAVSAVGLSLAAPLALAVPDVTAVVAEVEGWYAATGPVTLVGAAVLTAAAVAVGYKWIKGMIFS